jgi:hypothetical protein
MSQTNDNTKSVFSTLSAINVKDKIEAKNGLDYVSWANAWAMLKAHYPDAQRKVYESEHTGLNYFTDGKTAYVKVGIIVNSLEHIDYLPVMNHRNQAILLDSITAFDVNKTIQRSTAKAIAMHGLGIVLWTGEDLPEEDKTPISKQKQPAQLEELVMGSANWDKVSKYVAANKQLGAEKIVAQLSRKYTLSKPVATAIAQLIQQNNGS